MNPSMVVGIHLRQLTRISHILIVELDDYSVDRFLTLNARDSARMNPMTLEFIS